MATTNEIAANTKKVQDASQKAVPIVEEGFLDACIAAGTVIDHTPFLLAPGGGGGGGGGAMPGKPRAKPKGTASEASDACNVLLAHKYEDGKIDPKGARTHGRKHTQTTRNFSRTHTRVRHNHHNRHCLDNGLFLSHCFPPPPLSPSFPVLRCAGWWMSEKLDGVRACVSPRRTPVVP